MSLLILRTTVPPYCGLPKLSHQLPAVFAVVTDVVVLGVVTVVAVVVDCMVDWVVVKVEVAVLPQDVISRVTTMNRIKHKSETLYLNYFLQINIIRV
jgi:hypothetical protein